MSALARFRRHPGLSLRKTTRRLTKTVRRHLSVVLRLLVRAIAASAVFLGATAYHTSRYHSLRTNQPVEPAPVLVASSSG